MVQGKYIIILILKTFVFLITIFYSTISESIAWLPEEGRYKFSSNVLFIDRETRDSQKERAEMLSKAHREISILMKRKNLAQNEQQDLRELEAFVSDYEAFNDDIFVGNEIEYGLSQNQSFGLKANFSLEKNLQYKYTNNLSEESFKKNVVREVVFFINTRCIRMIAGKFL